MHCVDTSYFLSLHQTVPELVSDMADKNFNRLWFHHPQADRIYSALLEQVGYQVLKTKQIEFKYNFSCTAEYKGTTVSSLTPLMLISALHMSKYNR